jgi:uncharacterized membrane protein
VLTTRAPTRIRRAASSALGWTAVLVCAVYAAFALAMAIAALLQLLGVTEAGGGRAAPPLFILHALSGAVALLAGSLQLRLATRLLRGRRQLHRRIGQSYVWMAWITSLSSLGVAAFFDVSLAAKTAFASVSLLWFITTTVAFLHIRQGRVRQHREWMIRSFSLACFFVTGSLWPPILAATALPEAIGYPLALFLSRSLNLAAAEWWIRRTRAGQHRDPAGRARHQNPAHRTITSTQLDGKRAVPAAPGSVRGRPARCAAHIGHRPV